MNLKIGSEEGWGQLSPPPVPAVATPLIFLTITNTVLYYWLFKINF